MAFTQSDIDTLKAAMKSGVKSVTYADGRGVTYRDIGEMQSVLALMQNDVDQAASTPSISYASFDRGDCA